MSPGFCAATAPDVARGAQILGGKAVGGGGYADPVQPEAGPQEGQVPRLSGGHSVLAPTRRGEIPGGFRGALNLASNFYS